MADRVFPFPLPPPGRDSTASIAANILRLRRRIWRRLRSAVNDIVGPMPRAIRRYEARHRRELLAPARPVALDQVLERALAADLIFCGDYHTFRPAQAFCLRLLEAIAMSASPRVVLFLELAATRHQRHLDSYLSGEIDEDTLLAKLRYGRTWGFSWSGYRPILEYARANGIVVRALNGPRLGQDSSLAERDAWAAGVVADEAVARPDARFLVMTGDLHLGAAHLPLATKHQLAARGMARRAVRIFQDCEDLYWRLAAGQPEPEACALGADAFCVFNGTPWARVESYLSWLEGGEGAAASGFESGGGSLPDYTEHILDLTDQLSRFLGVSAAGAESYSVETADGLPLLDDRGRSPAARRVVEKLLGSDVFVLPDERILCIARLDLGSAAEAASELLLELSAAARDPLGRGPEAFFERVLRRSIAWLGSKILDPRRLTGARSRSRTLIAAYVRALPRLLIPGAPALVAAAAEDDLRLRLAVSRALGQAIGERLYLDFVAGRTTTREVRAWFTSPPRGLAARDTLREIYGEIAPPVVSIAETEANSAPG